MLLSQIRAEEVQLEPGDRMVFGADGITAASNREDEKFGIERASEAIRRACEAAAGRGDDSVIPRAVISRDRPRLQRVELVGGPLC